MAAVWCTTAIARARQLTSERHGLSAGHAPSTDAAAALTSVELTSGSALSLLTLRLDLCRAVVMMSVTLTHLVLLGTRRIRPWTAFRNLALFAPTVTGACMLASTASLGWRLDGGQVYTPSETPVAVALTRMGSCYLVAIASCEFARVESWLLSTQQHLTPTLSVARC